MIEPRNDSQMSVRTARKPRPTALHSPNDGTREMRSATAVSMRSEAAAIATVKVSFSALSMLAPIVTEALSARDAATSNAAAVTLRALPSMD